MNKCINLLDINNPNIIAKTQETELNDAESVDLLSNNYNQRPKKRSLDNEAPKKITKFTLTPKYLDESMFPKKIQESSQPDENIKKKKRDNKNISNLNGKNVGKTINSSFTPILINGSHQRNKVNTYQYII